MKPNYLFSYSDLCTSACLTPLGCYNSWPRSGTLAGVQHCLVNQWPIPGVGLGTQATADKPDWPLGLLWVPVEDPLGVVTGRGQSWPRGLLVSSKYPHVLGTLHPLPLPNLPFWSSGASARLPAGAE